MSENTKIQWTDHTFNPWIGCSHVHAGCTHCYAESFAKRYGKAQWGVNGTRAKTSDSNWRLPHKWNRDAEKAGERRRVFCASLADVFEDWQGEVRDHKGGIIHRCRPGHTYSLDAVYANGVECQSGCNRAAHPITLDDLRRDLCALIDATPWLDWLLLTKRPENVRRMLSPRPGGCIYESGEYDPMSSYRPNVWLGTSISDQPTADVWIPRLLECRDLCPVLFLSAEPLLGLVDLTAIKYIPGEQRDALRGEWRQTDTPCIPGRPSAVYESGASTVDWVIIGGESGPHARPCDVAWIRSLVEQCAAAGVPAFVKQLGASPFDGGCDAIGMFDGSCGHGMAMTDGRHHLLIDDSKGGDPAEWPKDLRVRQFPAAAQRIEPCQR